MVYYLSNASRSAGDVFAALADPTRRAIIQRLAKTDATINELAEPFGMSLQAVSKHIRVLEEAGIVQRKKIGRSHHCRLNHQAGIHARSWLEQVESEWQHRLDRLGDYLEQSGAADQSKKKNRTQKNPKE